MGKMPDDAADGWSAILKGWHPAWVIALVFFATLALNSHKIIRAFGKIRNEKLKILLKDKHRSRKINNALSDRRKGKGKG